MSWITGKEILERPGWESEQDLIDAYEERGLSPYRQIGRARMTRNSKCFNCSRANKDFMPGRIDEQGGPCLPLQWPSLRQDTGGLRIPRSAPSYATAKEFDPELAEHFFQGGEFTLDAGCVSVTNARLLRFLTAMVGADAVERMVLENVCDRHEPMSPLDMGDRLKAARFRLKDVEAYEDLHGIGQDGAGQVEEARKPDQVPPHFTSAEDLVNYYREQGVHELHELARQVDEEFAGKARLTDETLGRLLPANPGAEISAEGHKRQGHRLRKAYQQERRLRH